MNPFVNPNKRGVTLPHGCKDLVDVLSLPNHHVTEALHNMEALRVFINLMFNQAREDHASQIKIGPVLKDAKYEISYLVNGSWFDLSSSPPTIRNNLIAELLCNMARPSMDSFPYEGIITVKQENSQTLWRISMTRPDDECVIVLLGGYETEFISGKNINPIP